MKIKRVSFEVVFPGDSIDIVTSVDVECSLSDVEILDAIKSECESRYPHYVSSHIQKVNKVNVSG